MIYVPSSLQQLIAKGARSVLGWFDRRAEDPVMRRRINAGSDAYFAESERNQAAFDPSDLLADREQQSGSEPTLVDSTESIRDRFRRERKRALIVLLVLIVAVVYALGLNGMGPLDGLDRLSRGRTISLVVTLSLLGVVGTLKFVRSTIAAVRAYRMLREGNAR